MEVDAFFCAVASGDQQQRTNIHSNKIALVIFVT
jgi:methylglyoxal synthase